MRVAALTIRNFRGIEDLSLDTSASRNAVLVGINGSGKSSILDCIAITLGSLLSRLPGFPRPRRRLEAGDIRSSGDECILEMVLEHGGESQTIRLRAVRGADPDSLETECSVKGDCIDRAFAGLENMDIHSTLRLPVAAYYPVHRAMVHDRVLSPPPSGSPTLQDAYEGALDGTKADFGRFFSWFLGLEQSEGDPRDHRALDAVRRAIEMMVPGFSHPRMTGTPPRMLVTKEDRKTGERTELRLEQLSDGERSLIAMAGDIARRLATANPGLADPLSGRGIVLIDQIELHLHPAWQRRIVPALEGTFPNCQFIVTTHSPQVLSLVRPQAVYLLEHTRDGVVCFRPTASYGRDSNRILEEVMGVSERPEEVQRNLRDYFRCIDEGRMEEAAKLRKMLEQEIGSDDPEFARADVLIRRREIMGR